MTELQHIEPYFEAGLPLILVNRATKTPAEQGWNTKASPERNDEIKDKLYLSKKGKYNVGVVPPSWLVILDFDPDNFPKGVDVYSYIQTAFPSMSFNDYLVVNSGGGGKHVYMRKPKDIELKKYLPVKTKSNEMVKLSGLDILSSCEGVKPKYYAVCAGCLHSSGNHYKWDRIPTKEELLNLKEAPKDFIDYITKKSQPVNVHRDELYNVSITKEQLKQALDQLPIEKYRDYNSWLDMLMSSCHATSGQGYEVFLEWSLGDSKYKNAENDIEKTWNNFKERHNTNSHNGQLKTVAHINKELKKNTAFGSTLEFSDVQLKPQTDSYTDRYKLEYMNSTRDFFRAIDRSGAERTYAVAKSLVDALPMNRGGGDLSEEALTPVIEALEAIARVRDEKKKIMLNTRLKNKANIQGFTALQKEVHRTQQLKIMGSNESNLAEYTLRKVYGFRGLFHRGDIWFAYLGRFWKRIDEASVEKETGKIYYEIKLADGFVGVPKENHVIAEAMRIIKRETHCKDDRLRLNQQKLPIINVLNGEIHFNIADGSLEFRNYHDPASLQTTIMDVKYDPEADCPMFKEMLRVTFSKCEDPEDMVRYIGELIGYTISPIKFLEKIFILLGTGGDGKSTLVNITRRLIGREGVFCASLSELKTDSHILASVIGKLMFIDEDLNKRTALPDGWVKKLSSSKSSLNANPKNRDRVDFQPCCALYMCANNAPISEDMSEGMMRRVDVIPFEMKFTRPENEHIRDISIEDKILNKEKAGILNFAIEGLKRVLKNKKITPSVDVTKRTKKWYGQANKEHYFVSLSLIKSEGHEIDLDDYYDSYAEWVKRCARNGKNVNKESLRAYVESCGFIVQEKGLRATILNASYSEDVKSVKKNLDNGGF